jgi:hypothetical protein
MRAARAMSVEVRADCSRTECAPEVGVAAQHRSLLALPGESLTRKCDCTSVDSML